MLYLYVVELVGVFILLYIQQISSNKNSLVFTALDYEKDLDDSCNILNLFKSFSSLDICSIKDMTKIAMKRYCFQNYTNIGKIQNSGEKGLKDLS